MEEKVKVTYLEPQEFGRVRSVYLGLRAVQSTSTAFILCCRVNMHLSSLLPLWKSYVLVPLADE